jgi:hypothetical protein
MSLTSPCCELFTQQALPGRFDHGNVGLGVEYATLETGDRGVGLR